MTEDEANEEYTTKLAQKMRDRYDLERILVLAECSESMDAIILAAEIRRLRLAEKKIRDLHIPTMENGIAVGCFTCDWDIERDWPCQTLKALGGK